MAQIPTRNISQFKSKLIGGGARPNLFEVNVAFPSGVDLGIQGDGCKILLNMEIVLV